MGKAILLFSTILALSVPQARAETFMLLVEELCDDSAAGRPLASEEGIMARMFELGQVTFDSGPYAPQADWSRLEFREPLELAREGRAHYLAAVRIQSKILGSVSTAEGSAQRSFAQIRAQARYYLWHAPSGKLLWSGESALDNLGRERELPYEPLLFQLGDLLARELVRLTAAGL